LLIGGGVALFEQNASLVSVRGSDLVPVSRELRPFYEFLYCAGCILKFSAVKLQP
jgi:hypothetical protein